MPDATMPMPDYREFFEAYVDLYTAAVEGKPVIGDLRHCYGEYLVGASPGTIMGGENGEDYGTVLARGFDFYRAIGMKRMLLRGVESTEVFDQHDLVRVNFRAEIERKDGSPMQVDFTGVYILQRRASGPKIFAFVADGELALFRELGLVDSEGNPA